MSRIKKHDKRSATGRSFVSTKSLLSLVSGLSLQVVSGLLVVTLVRLPVDKLLRGILSH
jgi:hypothetical protein